MPIHDVPYQPWSSRRVEDPRLVTGAGTYVGDLRPEGLLHAAFIRGDVAHGTITSLDLDDARSSPGVVAVLSAADLDLPDMPPEGPVSISGMHRPPLARDRVRHLGEAVGVVVAETAPQAVDAAGLAWVDIDPLPAVTDVHEALADTTVLHPDDGTNVVDRWSFGSPDEGWEHDIEVEVTVRNQRLASVPIETLSALAVPETDGGVTLWVGHQAPHRLKRQLVAILDVEDIEVKVPDVGGGFGTKGRLYPEYLVLLAAAHRLGRPVRWLQTRREHFLCGAHGRDMIHRVRLAGDSTGRIRRAHVEILAAVGAYPQLGAQVPTFSRLVAQGLYDIPHLTLATTTVVTTAAPTAPYRGAGRPEAAYAIERAVDAFARRAGLDPVEVRRANFISPAAFPYRTATGALYDSGDYPAALDKALELLDLPALRREQEARRQSGDDPIGIGIGAFIERAGGPLDSAEYARVQLDGNGRLVVHTGSTSNGQGHATVWAQVAASVFGLPIDRVDVVAGDTAVVADGWGSMGSRSAQLGASAVLRTARAVRDQAARRAAEMLEVAVEDLTLTAGSFGVAGVPGVAVTLEDVARKAAEAGIELAADENFSPGAQTFPNGVHAAVVEVSLETGEVRLRTLVAVDDCGVVLNPMIVDGQIQGSLAQGIGQALFEEIVYDGEGQLRSSTLMDYLVLTAADMPELRLGRVVSPAPSNPLGAKGSGEAGCIGAPPAIVNAVLDALAPFGVTHLDMPLRPQVVWEAIRRARGEPA